MNFKTACCVLVLMLSIISLGFSQTAVLNADGTWDVTVPVNKGKDKAYSAIKLVVSKGVAAKKSSTIKVDIHQLGVVYNSDTKEYTMVINGESFTTTTVAAIRDKCMVYFYKQVTGKPLN